MLLLKTLNMYLLTIMQMVDGMTDAAISRCSLKGLLESSYTTRQENTCAEFFKVAGCSPAALLERDSSADVIL